MNIMGYTLVQTCGACPEQYDVYKDDEYVGYLRLRGGVFTVEDHKGDVIYTTHPKGDGIFEEDERPYFLRTAIQRLSRKCPFCDAGIPIKKVLYF